MSAFATDRRRLFVACVAMVIAGLGGSAAHGAPIKTWSGTIKLATSTEIVGNDSAQIPYDSSSPANDVFSSSRDLSQYKDGHYRVKISTDPLTPNPVQDVEPSVSADVQLTNGVNVHIGYYSARRAGWSATFCLPKDSKYLRIRPHSYIWAQQDVGWTIQVLDHTC